MKNILASFIAAAVLAGCGPGTAGHPEEQNERDGESHAGHDHGSGGHDHHGEDSGKEEDHGHEGEAHERGGGDEHDHGADNEGARFVEGRGIALADETRRAIAVETIPAEERDIAPVANVEAQVYRSAAEATRAGGERSGFAYASALLPPRRAASLRPGDSGKARRKGAEFSARVWKIESSARDAVGNEEVILEIPDKEGGLRIGDFVSGSVSEAGGAKRALAVPRSAVLETAAGAFVFVEREGFFLRRAVSTGAESEELVEIVEGVVVGDAVVVAPAETLYLIELRATKGGGHSH